MVSRLANWISDCFVHVHDAYLRFLDRHVREPFERTVIETTLILLGIGAIEVLVSPPPAFRLLYIAPLWIAARAQGARAGLVMVAMTTLVATILDAWHERSLGWEGVFNCLMYGTLMLLLMLHIARVEHGIQAYAQLASVDPLTGLYNRFALKEAAAVAIENARVTGKPLVLAVIDCDKFKRLNDEFGHAHGDSVLILLGKQLKRFVRSPGVVARTGGDEFVIMLPGKHLDEAARIVERVSEAFLEQSSHLGRAATISYGLAKLNIHGIDLDSLLSAADRNMYLAKSARVEFQSVTTARTA